MHKYVRCSVDCRGLGDTILSGQRPARYRSVPLPRLRPGNSAITCRPSRVRWPEQVYSGRYPTTLMATYAASARATPHCPLPGGMADLADASTSPRPSWRPCLQSGDARLGRSSRLLTGASVPCRAAPAAALANWILSEPYDRDAVAPRRSRTCEEFGPGTRFQKPRVRPSLLRSATYPVPPS